MEFIKRNWIWIVAVLVVAILIVILVAKTKSSGGGTTGSSIAGSSGSQNQGGGGSSGSGGGTHQVLKTYTCETKKVCQGRGGYANWVKTGTQKKCNASNLSQALCITDCKGTCYTWEDQ